MHSRLTGYNMLNNNHSTITKLLPSPIIINDEAFTFQATRMNLINLNWIVVVLTSDNEFISSATPNVTNYIIIIVILLFSSFLMLFLASCLSCPIHGC